ncbi:hypothetical protein E2C01_035954 [Portunus trituberculatus]|uniref:Uncharacterized protein n=1 Tax=Portunus trituberculatus TaxID=210409 RepID=A0A5B7FB41_PORTR|nr:hypothetical protein [Portunus trituberculatus]
MITLHLELASPYNRLLKPTTISCTWKLYENLQDGGQYDDQNSRTDHTETSPQCHRRPTQRVQLSEVPLLNPEWLRFRSLDIMAFTGDNRGIINKAAGTHSPNTCYIIISIFMNASATTTKQGEDELGEETEMEMAVIWVMTILVVMLCALVMFLWKDGLSYQYHLNYLILELKLIHSETIQILVLQDGQEDLTAH